MTTTEGYDMTEHTAYRYKLGGMHHLTCSCESLAVSYIGPVTDEEMTAKFHEHVAEENAVQSQLTDAELESIRNRWNWYADPVNGRDYDSALTSVHDVPDLLAEVDRLRAQVAQYHKSADEHTAKFDQKHEALLKARSEIERLRAELKAAKSTRFENNGVGDVAAHIQAETINDLRLN